MITIRQSIMIGLICISGAVQALATSPSEKLNKEINSLRVEEKWQKGKVINCKTGEALQDKTEKYESKKLKRLTHCGCFVYAAALAYGVPEASLPPHPTTEDEFIPALSNKQADWYNEAGPKHGWQHIENKDLIENYLQAQKLANEGYLVVASYKNPNSKRAGHTAIVISSDKSLDLIKTEGPDIAQAGNNNFSKGSLKKGFKNKKDAFKDNNLKFYYYNKLTS